MLEFPRQIPAGPEGEVAELLGEIERGLRDHFTAGAVRIVWAMRDIGFTPGMLERQWLATFPGAAVTRLDEAGHYLQEDAPERIVAELLGFLAERTASR
ncbi:hypothetical protein ABZ639_09605 [Saccharomonospora sp. NPDC006951]